MDDPTKHESDESKKNIGGNELIVTPADIKDPSQIEDEPKKMDAEQVANDQESKWLDDVKSGKRELDDMPENLKWLKERVAKKLESKKPELKIEGKNPDLKSAVREVLSEDRAIESFTELVSSLEKADMDEEQGAQLTEEYEGMIAEYKKTEGKEPSISKQYSLLKLSCRLVGLKDVATISAERRRKGLTLPPLGGKKRETIKPNKTSEAVDKFSKNLPPGFKFNK